MSFKPNPSNHKKNIVFYFQVHQPRRLRTLRFFDIGLRDAYFDDAGNAAITRAIAERCYLPANALLLKLIRQHPDIRVAFSISGTAIDQFEAYAPEVVASFQALAQTGSVEFLTETYYHSLACLNAEPEFEEQILLHREKMVALFGSTSEVFRNTELIHSEETSERIHRLGFRGVLLDGVSRVCGQCSPHHVFRDGCIPELALLARDYRLSDDIAFRYGQHDRPFTAARYTRWLEKTAAESEVILLGMDYETFGEHHRRETGIFGFMEALFLRLACHEDFVFATPTDVVNALPARDTLRIPGYVSWADEERDLSAWLGNDMQRDAFDFQKRIASVVQSLGKDTFRDTWRNLQTSDHFYYMSTKQGSDGQVHNYFSPYPSPYEAFINYMNVLTDFSERLRTYHRSGATAPTGVWIPEKYPVGIPDPVIDTLARSV